MAVTNFPLNNTIATKGVQSYSQPGTSAQAVDTWFPNGTAFVVMSAYSPDSANIWLQVRLQNPLGFWEKISPTVYNIPYEQGIVNTADGLPLVLDTQALITLSNRGVAGDVKESLDEAGNTVKDGIAALVPDPLKNFFAGLNQELKTAIYVVSAIVVVLVIAYAWKAFKK